MELNFVRYYSRSKASMSVVRAAMIDLIQTESAKTYGDKITGHHLIHPLRRSENGLHKTRRRKKRRALGNCE